MNRKRRFGVLLAAGVCLAGVAGAQLPRLSDYIEDYELKVAKERHGRESRELLIDLNLLASFYR